MGFSAVKRFIPVALKQPVRDYLDARSWRLQPRLAFDATQLRVVSSGDLKSAMIDPAIGSTFAEDHRKIASVYGIGEIEGGVNPGDRRAIYHLASHFKPARVLEIGTHIGASTIYFASALRRFGGRLTTADIVDVNALDADWRELGMTASPAAIVSRLGLDQTVAFVTKAASDVLQTSERFDLIFLDGDHSPLAVYREISAALRLLNPGGLILLHDFYPDVKPLTPGDTVIAGPHSAASRILTETDAVTFLPLGELPWPTKNGGNATSLALVARRERHP
jgi:predicted O-methyltransferase YrrM